MKNSSLMQKNSHYKSIKCKRLVKTSLWTNYVNFINFSDTFLTKRDFLGQIRRDLLVKRWRIRNVT